MPEYTEHVPSGDVTELVVSVSKVGGGTLGKAYEGDWDVTVGQVGFISTWCYVLHTGTPKGHGDVARLAAEFYESEGNC